MMKAANIPKNTHAEALMIDSQNRWHGSCVMGGMLQRLTLIAFILLPFMASGQFGVNARFLTNDFTLGGEKQTGIHAGVEYHFRIKSNRIEFHPELGYRRNFESKGDFGQYSSIDFDFNTSIYPFDFEGDCNCPTFSKQGTLIKKGFYFELQPGIGYQTISLPTIGEDDSRHIMFKLGVAAGLDIGISDHYTITPFVSGTRFFLGPFEEDLGEGITMNFIVFSPGLRLSYSVDDKKRRRRN